MLAARRPVGLRGVVLCASFVRFPLPVPERWRGAVRPWMFRLQPLWLVSFAFFRRYCWRQLRAAVPSVSLELFAVRARAVARVDVTAELRGAAAVPTRGRGLGGPTGLLGVGSVGAAGRKGGYATRAALSSPSGPSRVSGRTGLFLRSGVSGGSAEQIADLIRPKPDWGWG